MSSPDIRPEEEVVVGMDSVLADVPEPSHRGWLVGAGLTLSGLALVGVAACGAGNKQSPENPKAGTTSSAPGSAGEITSNICAAVGLNEFIRFVDPATYQQIQTDGGVYPMGKAADPGSLNWYGSANGHVYDCTGEGASGVRWEGADSDLQTEDINDVTLTVSNPATVYGLNDDSLRASSQPMQVGNRTGKWYPGLQELDVDDQAGHTFQFQVTPHELEDPAFTGRLASFASYAVSKITGSEQKAASTSTPANPPTGQPAYALGDASQLKGVNLCDRLTAQEVQDVNSASMDSTPGKLICTDTASLFPGVYAAGRYTPTDALSPSEAQNLSFFQLQVLVTPDVTTGVDPTTATSFEQKESFYNYYLKSGGKKVSLTDLASGIVLHTCVTADLSHQDNVGRTGVYAYDCVTSGTPDKADAQDIIVEVFIGGKNPDDATAQENAANTTLQAAVNNVLAQRR